MEPISTFRRVFAKLTMPFISKYKLSTSNPFGLGRLVSGGRVTVPPFSSETAIGWSSMTCSTKAPGQFAQTTHVQSAQTNFGIFFTKPPK